MYNNCFNGSQKLKNIIINLNSMGIKIQNLLLFAFFSYLSSALSDSDLQIGRFAVRGYDGTGYIPETFSGWGHRIAKRYVSFPTPFPPHCRVKVTTFMSLIDQYHGANLRYNAYPTDITPYGYNINISVWGDTIVYITDVSWTAVCS